LDLIETSTRTSLVVMRDINFRIVLRAQNWYFFSTELIYDFFNRA